MTEHIFLPGLRPFETTEATHFLGRQTLAQDIYATWRHQGEHGRTFLALLGARDSGKSSLLRAGVLPLLAKDAELSAATWRQAVWYPSDDLENPLRGLAAALLKALPELEQQQHIHTEQLSKLLTDHSKATELLLKTTLDLVANLPAVSIDHNAPLARLVLLIENLEHLLLPQFTLEQREMICARLSSLANSGRCWILASMDEAALEHISECPNFAKLLAGTGQYRLQAPQVTQWQTILHAGLGEKAIDSGCYTQMLDAVRQQPYPLSAVQAVFRLAQKGCDWTAIDGLNGALEHLVRLELADFPAEERAALPAILEQFAVTPAEPAFITRRQPLTQLGHAETHRETLQRLLAKGLMWEEKLGETRWLAANATLLQTLHNVCANFAEAAPVPTPVVAVEVESSDDKIAFKRYFPWRPALVMGLLVILLAVAVAFLPHYQDRLKNLVAQLQSDWQNAHTASNPAVETTTSRPEAQTLPEDNAVNSEAPMTALLNLPEKPPLPPLSAETPAEPAPAAVEPQPATQPQTDTSPTHLDELAAAQEQQQAWAQALTLYQQALEIRLSLRSETGANTSLFKELSRNYDQIGNLQQRLEQHEAALLSYHEALSVSQKLYKQDAENAAYQRDLAISYARLGDFHHAQQDYEQAQTHYVDALSYFLQAAQTDKRRRNQRALAVAYDKLGDVQVLQNDKKAALTSYQSALSVRQTLLLTYRDQQSQQEVLYSNSKINSLWQTMR